MKILIIGGAAGGATAAARLRRLNKNAEIIMFEKDEFITYANCGLPYYIGDIVKEKDSLWAYSPEEFSERSFMDVRIFNEVAKINKDEKTVEVKDHKLNDTYTQSYDKLIIATGARPIIPPIPGIDNEKVFTLRTIPDAEKIKDFIEENSPRTAVIIGGGYIGLEIGENLTKIGIDVSIVEMQDQILKNTLDSDMAVDLEKYIMDNSIDIVLNNGVKEIKDDEKLKIILNDDKSINADMIILSVGILPESKLAIDGGLKTGNRGTIIVDSHLKTSDNDIYAVGDCVEFNDIVLNKPSYIPLAVPANKQGRIAADNISGLDTIYKGTLGSALLKLFDKTVGTTGITEEQAKNEGINAKGVKIKSWSHASYYPNSKSIDIKIIFNMDNGKILGGQIIGEKGIDKRLDVLGTLIQMNGDYQDLLDLEMAYAPPYNLTRDPLNIIGQIIEREFK